MSTSLAGQVALVTGASRGIGRAIAVRLGAEGAAVVINFRSNVAAAEETARLVRDAGGTPTLVPFDVGDAEATRAAVVNLTDDVMLFAQGAIANAQFPAGPAAVVRGVVLEAACSWREVEVRTLDANPPRARIVTRVVHRGTRREFLGFNRARHAVLEAAILATRTHLLPADQIHADFARLQVIVDKTAGPRELEAMALLNDYVRAREAAHA